MDAVAQGLKQRAQQDDQEQAVYGFDALPELGLHPLVRDALRAHGFGVWPEQRYPEAWRETRRTRGQRCDLVLSPDDLPLRDAAMRATLFADQPGVDACDAYWLEIKAVSQFERGEPFQRYKFELFTPVARDLGKLAASEMLRWRGLLLLLFTESARAATRDAEAWLQHCRALTAISLHPQRQGFAINNRAGNGWCEVVLVDLSGLEAT